jgi:hypothetical protein
MKKIFGFVVLIYFIMTSCEKRIEIPKNSKIIAKYVVFHDSISRKILEDLKDIKPFDKNNEDYKQPFKLDEKIYQFETEYRLSSEGRLARFDEHEYNSFDYSDLGLNKVEIGDIEKLGLNILIKFSPTRKQIIDCKDSFEIEKVYHKEKLIFVQRNDGRINIYEYQ